MKQESDIADDDLWDCREPLMVSKYIKCDPIAIGLPNHWEDLFDGIDEFVADCVLDIVGRQCVSETDSSFTQFVESRSRWALFYWICAAADIEKKEMVFFVESGFSGRVYVHKAAGGDQGLNRVVRAVVTIYRRGDDQLIESPY